MAKKETKTVNKKEKNSKDKTSFFKSFKAELKKVSWPTPKQLVNNTVAVVVIVLILSAIVFVLDLTFESANKYGVDKVKEAIITSNDENIQNNETEESSEDGVEGASETTQTQEQNTETTQDQQE